MKLIPPLKFEKGQVSRAIAGIGLGGVLVWSWGVFIHNEGSRFLELLMLLLTAWAIYLAFRGGKEFLIILTGFLATNGIFNLWDLNSIASWLATVVFVLVYLFLFYIFQTQDWSKIFTSQWKEKVVYAGLACLIAAEFFMILKFFPVDAKNRAIILTVVFWYFNQVYYYHHRRQLKGGIMFNLTAAFLVILGVIMFSLPFLGR